MAQKVVQTSVLDEEHFKALVYNPEDPRLFVVDVYSPCWGPCKIMVPTFAALVPQIDDFEERCQLLTADASAITELAKYNGTSQPRFLFYKEGALVKDITGANAPAIVKAITALIPEGPRPA
ncbi:thioredoxin dynein outer arm protein [Cystoisospora suis]|uniref:Thioredoxin dynein outer arm protein n=1 Tax=Cystoisospora suis TaxID=483139 RepID=A0A2C6KSR6_9APIC|nr:thioredoxin dynein outer arm protein [Cystoisospora suis]